MEEKVGKRAPTVVDYVETIIDKVKQKYKDVVCLMSDAVYGDEDVDIEIYTPENQLLEVEEYAHEVALRETEGTDFFILPSVAPLECCPVRLT